MPQERQRIRDSSKDDAQFIILVRDVCMRSLTTIESANFAGEIPRQCRWQELKDMTRHLGGEQSLKAEVFELRDGSQLGHCTVKGRTAANQVYGTLNLLRVGMTRPPFTWLITYRTQRAFAKMVGMAFLSLSHWPFLKRGP
jgi:hypothetical protein